jgi:PPP family 3-phenylpropionic acid transporter
MPYWRLSSFYFFYFAALGALVPYWGLYLKSLGFGAVEIGSLTAILMATKIVAPYIWGWLGDHLGHRMHIVRGASLVSVLTFAMMFWADGFWPIAAVMSLFSFFWNASLPQFEVVTLNYLGRQVRRYALLRVWGSIGFILTVLLLGVLVEREGPAIVLSVVFMIYLGIWLASLAVRDPAPEAHPHDQPPISAVLLQPAVLAFFAAVFLMQFSHGPYYAFYTIYMTDQGYGETLIGGMWALGVAAEVVVFMLMHRLLEAFGARRVLVASLAIAAVRWLLIGMFPAELWVMLLAQLMHAATFGTFHASAIHLAHHFFHGRHKGRGQALYSSLSFGAGGALGSLLAGHAWDALGPLATYLLAGGAALVGALIAWRLMDPREAC